jgi:hypothetical protein
VFQLEHDQHDVFCLIRNPKSLTHSAMNAARLHVDAFVPQPHKVVGAFAKFEVVFSHSLNARGRSIASGETEVVSPAKHKRDNAEAIFS